MSNGSEQIHEYRHRNGVDAISVRVGSESDLAYAGEPDWELTGESPAPVESAPEVEDVEPEVEEAPEETPAETPDAIDYHDYFREELDAIAAQRGIEDPKEYGTKAEVAQAINEAATEEQP